MRSRCGRPVTSSTSQSVASGPVSRTVQTLRALLPPGEAALTEPRSACGTRPPDRLRRMRVSRGVEARERLPGAAGADVV